MSNAKVITVAQQKGGAGKTTLAIHLSTTLSAMGKSVALIDIDPQASVLAWDQMRQEALGEKMPDSPSVRSITGWRTASEVDRLRRDFDIIIIDSPPHAETEAKLAIRSGDIVVIPCQPSPMDLWATKPIIDLASYEGTPTLTVLNRVPPRANITEQIVAKAKQLDTTLAKSVIGNRVAFAESLAAGRGINEHEGSSTAATEIMSLAREVLGQLGLKAPTAKSATKKKTTAKAKTKPKKKAAPKPANQSKKPAKSAESGKPAKSGSPAKKSSKKKKVA